MRPALNRHFQYYALKAQAVLLLALGRRSGALRSFEQMLQRRPEDRYALASQAHVQVQLQRLDAAVASLQQLTRILGSGPQEAAALFNLGYVLQQAGRHEEAGPAFRSALALDSSLDRAWYGLALVLIHQRQFPEAVEALKKNTALQPMSPYGWYRLVQVRLALGQPEKARKIIAHLRQFEPRVAAQLERENELASGPSPLVAASVGHHAAH
ncbi:MAG: tetratricopeptide repeat protein [Polaromonas sp.]|uniref:tetratricopeptide repeat protein n=1 Tax=Polaromonas sp. TaxID=1869339 RepID=UPI00272F525E|nr:tetratricopeptide repeat protein [Polaromonas sp.]MDP2256386.1 tetratricopeptide repeat protein [Polaromonas sp.]